MEGWPTIRSEVHAVWDRGPIGPAPALGDAPELDRIETATSDGPPTTAAHNAKSRGACETSRRTWGDQSASEGVEGCPRESQQLRSVISWAAVNGGFVALTKKFLRRYTDLPALIHLLRTASITFLDPSSWDDKNDAYFMNLYKEGARPKDPLGHMLLTGN